MSETSEIVGFGAFHVDLAKGELRKHGLRIRLQEQPFQILAGLLQCPGEVVSREDLIRRVWPDGTVVDFDRGLNAAVTRLRQTLSDSAETPRYIETVARRGYRFIGSLHVDQQPSAAAVAAAPPSPGPVIVSSSRTLLLVVVALLLSGALLVWRLNRTQTEDLGRLMKAVPLTLAAGVERDPSFSPDGSQVVYQWEQEGRSHIYVKGLGAGEPVSLSSGDGVEYSPAWSPDGNSIAYIGRQQSSWGIFVVAPVGGTPRKVTDFSGVSFATTRRFYRYLDWTPDSRHVIVSAMGNAMWECLMLVSIETGEKTWLTHPTGHEMSGDREPAVSPDGRTVAFARGGLGFEHLYLLPLTADLRPAGPPRALQTAAPARSPVWVPGSGALIFAGQAQNVTAGLELYWLDPASKTPPRNLTAFGSGIATPAISRNGSLAYSTIATESTLWRQDIPTANEPAPAPVKVRSAATIMISPAYSPDGSHIAFASERYGTRQIWNCASDGSHCLQVTSISTPGVNENPRWSPDGKQIVFQSMTGAVMDVYMVNSTGGATRRLTTNDHHGGFPYWSHDGKWIYYCVPAKQHVIWKMPAQGGKPSQVSPGRVLLDSEDSSMLYYTDDGKLFRSASDGGGKTELLDDVSMSSFAVGGDRIYYLHSESEFVNEIRQLQLSTRVKSTVRRIDKPLVYGISLSPDGKSLLYVEIRRQGNVMIAESRN